MNPPAQPLRLPPGPRAVLPGGLFVRVRRRGLLAFLKDAAARYGDVAYFASMGQRFCLVSDPNLIRRILVTDNERFTKGPALRNAKPTLGEGLLTSEGEVHRRQRRLIAPAFHAQRVSEYADTFVAYAQQAPDGWRDGRPLDVTAAMTELTLHIVAKTLFDAELEREVRAIGQDMSVIVGMFERARNPLAPLLNRLPLASNRRFLRASGRLDATIAGLIAARRAAPDDPAKRDLLSLLLRARDAEREEAESDEAESDEAAHAGRGMTDRQLRDEAVTLFMAGHETTANALVWTWLLLSENPQAEAQLHRELDDVLAGRPPVAADMERLTYTRAIVAESLRLYPPAWVIARQAIEPYELAGYRLPAGTVFLMSQFVVHRDGRWWDGPETFRPERWLAHAGERPRYAYFPFGGGTRSCVGESFAWLEATMIVATLARQWRFGPVEPGTTRETRLFPTITLRPKEPVILMPRER